jgi:PAS domain S-box-containing protein
MAPAHHEASERRDADDALRAFEEMTGLVDPVGKTALELVPDLEVQWVRTYANVALGGDTLRFEDGSEAMGRWFDVFAMPVAPHGRFALVFKDITARKRTDDALRESEQRFRNMADNAPVMVWVTEPDGSCSFLNSTWYEFTGQRPEDALGFGWLAATHPDDRAATEAVFLQANKNHEPFRVDYRLRHHDGTYRWAIDSAAPRIDQDGTFRGYIGSVIDISDRKALEDALRDSETAERRARSRVELMADVVTELDRARDARARAERLVELLVPRIADFAVVRLPSDDGPIVATRHHQPERHESLRASMSAARPGHPADDARHHRRPRSSAGVTLGGAQEAVTRAVAESVGGTSYRHLSFDTGATEPAELLLGLTDDTRRPYDKDDETFLLDLAERVGVAETRAHLHDVEHRAALRLQRALLPSGLVRHPAVEIAAGYDAASDDLEVGGDWYDTFVLPDGRIGAMVGDVVGHGLEAAAVMGHLRAAALAYSADSGGPADLLTKLDRFSSGAGGSDYATAACVALDPRTGRLSYATAGHPPPLVVTPDRRSQWLDDARSLPLGLGIDARRRESHLELDAGALVVLYTDGLVERRRESLDAGLTRLGSLVARLRGDDIEGLPAHITRAMALDSGYEDDVAVVCLRLAGAATFG